MAISWTVIGELAPSAEWLSTMPTDANAFRFEHHNPPKRVILQIAQTDGTDWLFEPRTLSSDRGHQILLMERPAVFGAERRLSLRYADPNAVINNWTVKIYAAVLPIVTVSHLEDVMSGIISAQTAMYELMESFQTGLISLSNNESIIHEQLTSIAITQATQYTAIADRLGVIEGTLGLIGTPPTPTPTPTPAPTGPLASVTPYAVSISSVYGGTNAPTYTRLTDGIFTNASVTNDTGPQWLKATFSQAIAVSGVKVAGGNDEIFGSTAGYINGCILQYSLDDATWVNVATVSGATDTGAYTQINFSSITARYWRLYRANGFVGTSEFKFLP